MKIPDLFYPECKQSLRLIMRHHKWNKNSEFFFVLVSDVDESFGWKKKCTNGFNKFIITESQEVRTKLSCLKIKKQQFQLIFIHVLKCIMSQAPQAIKSYHDCTASLSQHCNYYIKCRTINWVLNTYLKGYKYIYLREGGGKIKSKHGNTMSVFSVFGRVGQFGWFSYLQVKRQPIKCELGLWKSS